MVKLIVLVVSHTQPAETYIPIVTSTNYFQLLNLFFLFDDHISKKIVCVKLKTNKVNLQIKSCALARLKKTCTFNFILK